MKVLIQSMSSYNVIYDIVSASEQNWVGTYKTLVFEAQHWILAWSWEQYNVWVFTSPGQVDSWEELICWCAQTEQHLFSGTIRSWITCKSWSFVF